MKVIRVGKKKKKHKPGPKTRLGGERMNFVPGEKFKTAMDEIIADTKKVTGERLTYAYILREGGVKEIRYIRDILAQAKSGRLGAKRRELFPESKELVTK